MGCLQRGLQGRQLELHSLLSNRYDAHGTLSSGDNWQNIFSQYEKYQIVSVEDTKEVGNAV